MNTGILGSTCSANLPNSRSINGQTDTKTDKWSRRRNRMNNVFYVREMKWFVIGHEVFQPGFPVSLIVNRCPNIYPPLVVTAKIFCAHYLLKAHYLLITRTELISLLLINWPPLKVQLQSELSRTIDICICSWEQFAQIIWQVAVISASKHIWQTPLRGRLFGLVYAPEKISLCSFISSTSGKI